jgi:hypothetical protein
MGGYGSGRSAWDARTTVEDCYALDINWMTREGIFDGCGVRWGSVRWSNSHTGEETSSLGYEVSVPQQWMRLRYQLVRNDENLDYKVPLTTTGLPWGGVRWWFTCPLSRDGQYCGHRVGKLYLPPGGRYYACRHCYHLTYESCNDSHKYDHLLAVGAPSMGLSPDALRGIVEEGKWMRDFERRRKRNEQRRRRRKAKGWA